MATATKKPVKKKKDPLAGLVAIVSKEVEIDGKAYCAGSGSKPGRAGAKYIGYAYKYQCPTCNGHYAKDGKGLLNKHGYSRDAKKKAYKAAGLREGFCGGCAKRKPMEEGDFLCTECRA